MSQRFFAAIVQRSTAWDGARPPQEQEGFASHAQYMGGLEASGVIAMAGLMQATSDVLFVFRAASEEEVRAHLAKDPWQQDGHARLVRLEEIHFRIGTPGG
jgi:uncharacterized protein YciI